MSKAITIRTDEETIRHLDAVSQASDKSRNYVANLALKEFLARELGAATGEGQEAPIAEKLDDYRSRFWVEDDSDEFLAYLAAERARAHVRHQSGDLDDPA